MSILSSHGCYMCTHGHPHISSHGPLKTSSHFAVHIHVSPILFRLCCEKTSEAVPSFPFGSGAFRLLRHRRCSLGSALMCISQEMRRDCNTCDGMMNRVLIDDGARWTLHGDEQDREIRTAGVKALHSMLASTTSGRAKEFVKQGLSDRNGMIAFGRIRERFGKTAGVAKLSVVCQFQWTSSDSLEASG